jgi:RNA polymerase sigma-70 factor (ECF subfamily)
MELLGRFASGDIEAFEALFRQLQAEVYGWIVRIVRDPGAAEDLTVETFWRIYRAHARFDPTKNPVPWVRRIATNVALDYLKHKQPESELSDEVGQANSPDPVLAHELQRQIQRAFHRLPPKLRIAAILALVEERPYEVIAEALGTTAGAVKLRVFRAVRMLRKQLNHLGVNPSWKTMTKKFGES